MKPLIKRLLREELEHSNTKTMLNELLSLMEKKISVGDNLTDKLNKIDTEFSNKLLSFLNSDDIKDDANVSKADYEKEDGKLLTVVDDKGSKRKLKFGRFLSYLGYPESEVQSREIEDIISHLKKSDTSTLSFIEGEEIRKVFDCGALEGNSGSCMAGADPSFFDIYVNNPSKVKALVIKHPETGKIIGRALVWNTDGGNKFMDKIYPNDRKDIMNVFYNYADKNGYEINKPSSDVTLDYTGDYKNYPYVDTFKYFTPPNKLSAKEGLYTLQSRVGEKELNVKYLFMNVDKIENNDYALASLPQQGIDMVLDLSNNKEGLKEKLIKLGHKV